MAAVSHFLPWHILCTSCDGSHAFRMPAALLCTSWDVHSNGLVVPSNLCFFSLTSQSQKGDSVAKLHLFHVEYMSFLEFEIISHFVSLCLRVSPHDCYLWPVKLLINFCWYFLPLFNFLIATTLQSPSLTGDNGVYTSSLLLKIPWQSRPRTRLKLVKIIDPTSNVYFIVLCVLLGFCARKTPSTTLSLF